MSDSEVFENYAAAMREQGLIAEADYADARRGSDDISTIEALYHIKPNDTDKTHIVDQAHPDVAVISPAYDRMHGVVENLRERNSIMVGIALKEPNGNLTQHRYVHAKKELLDELVRVGFMLDHGNEHGLMKLADSCSERLVKTAAWWFVPAGIAAVIGAVAAINKSKPSNQGVLNNIDNTIEQIEEARSEVPHLNKATDNLINILNQFKEYALNYENQSEVNVDVDTPSIKDVNILASDPNAINRAKVVQSYMRACKAMVKILPRYASVYAAASKSVSESEWPEWAAKFKDIWEEYASGNETSDVPKYLIMLAKSCQNAISSINAVSAASVGLATSLAQEMRNETATQIPAKPQPFAQPNLPSSLDESMEGNV